MTANFCTGCGAPLTEGDHFCTSCGAPADGAEPPAPPPPTSAVPSSPPPPPPPPPLLAPTSPAAPEPNPAGRSLTPLYVALGVLAVLVLGLGILVFTRGSDDGDDVAATETTTSVPRTTVTSTSTTTTTRPTTTTAAPTTAPPATAPTTPQAPDRSQQAIDDVAGAMCDATYITEYRSEELDFELYRVDVHIVLDSGEWWAHFDVDYATEFGPEISPADEASAEMLC